MKTYTVTVRIADQEIDIEAENEEEAKNEVYDRMNDVYNNIFDSDVDIVGVELVDDDDA